MLVQGRGGNGGQRDGREQLRTVGDCWGTAGDSMSDVSLCERISLWVYDFNLTSTRGLRGITIITYSPSGPHFPKCSRS